MPKRTEQRPKPTAAGAPELEGDHGGPEHRHFPRARVSVPFSVWIGEASDRRFSAKLDSVNLSVSGALLSSTFFLPVETMLRLSFELPGGEVPVQARAEITREERPDSQGRGRSGFAVQFVEFFDQTEVTLAKLFLGHQLRGFAEPYLASKRARSFTNELDRVVDALAAFELKRVTEPEAGWGLKQGPA